MTPLKIIIVLIIAGVCFIPTGTSVWQTSNSVFEKIVYYDNGGGSSGDQCRIDKQNQRRICTVSTRHMEIVTFGIVIIHNRFV